MLCYFKIPKYKNDEYVYNIDISVDEFSKHSSDLWCQGFISWFKIKSLTLEMTQLTTMVYLLSKSLKRMIILIFTLVTWLGWTLALRIKKQKLIDLRIWYVNIKIHSWVYTSWTISCLKCTIYNIVTNRKKEY